MSGAGSNEQGFYNSNLLLVETEQAMLDVDQEIMVVADSTKFGQQSLALLCPLNAVTTLVVDDGISDECKKKVEDAGVRLLIAEAASAASRNK